MRGTREAVGIETVNEEAEIVEGNCTESNAESVPPIDLICGTREGEEYNDEDDDVTEAVALPQAGRWKDGGGETEK